jgi:hypothetical protein
LLEGFPLSEGWLSEAKSGCQKNKLQFSRLFLPFGETYFISNEAKIPLLHQKQTIMQTRILTFAFTFILSLTYFLKLPFLVKFLGNTENH